MKPQATFCKVTVFMAGSLALAYAFATDSAPAKVVSGESGTVSFQSPTNMPGIEVSGKSSSLTFQVEVAPMADKVILRRIDATLPVKSLTTGMKIRDEHMRKYIFRTADGQEPDLHFTAEESSCAGGSNHEYVCQVNGALSIRGVTQPFTTTLRVKEEGGSAERFRTTAGGIVKLSAYQIERPTQFGVKPEDDVKLRFDFTGKTRVVSASAGARP